MSPDLETILRDSAPSPESGPDMATIGRRARRRRATRLGAAGGGVAAVVAAAFLVATNQANVELPIPDVVNPQPTGFEGPSPEPSADPGLVGLPWTPPRLDVIGVMNNHIVRRHLDASVTELAANPDTERSMTALTVSARGDDLLGAYVNNIGESDDLWWFRMPIDGDAPTVHERLPDEYQPRQSGGVTEIGWPAPALASAGVLTYVEAQGSSPEFGGDGYVSTIRIVPFDEDLTPSATETRLELPRWGAPLVAQDFESCPGQDEAICLLTIDDFRLREFWITTDGELQLESPPTTMEPTAPGAPTTLGNEILDVASTTHPGGTVRRWMLSASREWSLIDVDTRTDETIIGLPFQSPRDTLLWFDVFEDTAVVVTEANALIIDLATGRMADGPDALIGMQHGSIVGADPVEPEELAASRAEFLIAVADGTITGFTGGEPIAEAVVLALGSTVHKTLTGNDRFSEEAWTILLDESALQKGFAGSFSIWAELSDPSRIRGVTVNPTGQCERSGGAPAPAGMETYTRVRIDVSPEADDGSCTDWFSIDLFLDESADIAGVALQLW